MSELRRQATLVAYRAFSDVAGKGALLLITLVAARRLSREAFGLFALGSTVGWIAAVGTDFGIQLHLARVVAFRPRDAQRLLRSWLHVRLWSSAAAAVALTAWLAITRPAPSVGSAILLFTTVYLLSGLVEFLHYFYRGLSRTDIESTLTLWQRLATLVFAVIALWYSPRVATLGAAMLVPAAATFLYSARRAHALAADLSGPSTSAHAPAVRSLGPEFASDVAPIGVGIVLSALYFRIDVFLVELWRGPDAVALYNAVFRLVDALRLFPAAVLAVALPVLCLTSGRGPLVRVASLVTLSGLGATAVLWVAADRLIPLLYGPRYIEAVPVFRILLLSFPLMSLNYALTHQLVGWHYHRVYAALSAIALVFNVGMNVRLIPSLGIAAAAWTTVWTEAVVTVGCLGSLGYVLSRASRAPLAQAVRTLEHAEPLDAVESPLVM